MSSSMDAKFAVSHATEDISKVLSDAGIVQEDVQWFLLHQANRRILESVRQRLNAQQQHQ